MGVYARKIYKPSVPLTHMPSKKAGEELEQPLRMFVMALFNMRTESKQRQTGQNMILLN